MTQLWLGNVPPGMPAAAVAGELRAYNIVPLSIEVYPKSDKYSFAIATFASPQLAAAALYKNHESVVWSSGRQIFLKCSVKRTTAHLIESYKLHTFTFSDNIEHNCVGKSYTSLIVISAWHVIKIHWQTVALHRGSDEQSPANGQ